MKLTHAVQQTLTVPITASHTTVGNPFTLMPYDKLAIVAKLVSVDTGTLDVYVQDSWDGTNWYYCAHFTQMTAAAATLYERVAIVDLTDPTAHMAFVSIGAPGTISSAGTPVIPANTYCPLPWGPSLRIIAVTGSGTNGAPAIQTFDFLTGHYYQ